MDGDAGPAASVGSRAPSGEHRPDFAGRIAPWTLDGGMLKAYRLEFVGPTGFVERREIRASSACAAIAAMASETRPPKAQPS